MQSGRVFLSYSYRSDLSRRCARELTSALGERGVAAWDGAQELAPGATLVDEIEAALRSSRVVVAILGQDDASSPWLYWELGAAAALGRPILTVLTGDVDGAMLPAPLRLREFVRWSNADDAADRVVSILTREPAQAS